MVSWGKFPEGVGHFCFLTTVYIIFQSTFPVFPKLTCTLPDELKREREFYRARGEVCPKDLPQANEGDTQQDDKGVNDTDYHRLDEQVCLGLYLLCICNY